MRREDIGVDITDRHQLHVVRQLRDGGKVVPRYTPAPNKSDPNSPIFDKRQDAHTLSSTNA
jgi:hypothetical protein